MKVPRSFVRVIFLSYPRGSGYVAGEQAPAAALDCTPRHCHTTEDKAELLMRVWAMFQRHTGIATDHLAISLWEIPSTNAMEMGQVMRPGIPVTQLHMTPVRNRFNDAPNVARLASGTLSVGGGRLIERFSLCILVFMLLTRVCAPCQ
jgi:hypothetical protein